MKNTTSKPSVVFDDYSDVKECTECSHWWDNSCDGSSGSVRPCNAFQATRRVKLPEDVKRLRTRLDLLTGAVVLVVIAQIAMLIWR